MSAISLSGNDNNSGADEKNAWRSFSKGNVAHSVLDIYGGNWAIDAILNDLSIIGHGSVDINPIDSNSVFFHGIRPRNYTGLKINNFTFPVNYNPGSQPRGFSFVDCEIKRDTYSSNGLFYTKGRSTAKNTYEKLERLLVSGYDSQVDVQTSQSTFANASIFTFLDNDHGDSVHSESIIIPLQVVFLSPCQIIRELFNANAHFTYTNGLTSINQGSFDAFKQANIDNSWGFVIQNCFQESPYDTFIDYDAGIYILKPTSIAKNMSLNGGPIGGRSEGYVVKANSSGWANNSGFTLVGDSFEATGPATIEHTPIDMTGGGNKVIARIGGGFERGLENGRDFNDGGTLGTALVDGTDLTALGVALVADEVYLIEGFTEARTNLRTIPIVGLEAYIALAGEIVNEADGTGKIRPVTDYSGRIKIAFKMWRDGQTEPLAYSYAFIGEDLFVDSSGRTNAEVGYDESTERGFTARWWIPNPKVSDNNIPA